MFHTSVSALELTLAADERDGVGRGHVRRLLHADRPPRREPAPICPSRRSARRRGSRSRPRVATIREFADKDAVDRRRRLDARGGVHHVTRGDALALARSRADDDERFASVDADADLQIEPLVLGVQLVDRAADGERRSNGSLRIVLVRDRSAEQRDHRVADELLDRAAVALQLGSEAGIVGREPRSDVLRVHLLGLRGRADDVGEEDGDELPLLGRRLGAASGEPHARQNFAISGFSWPHCAQMFMLRVLLPRRRVFKEV